MRRCLRVRQNPPACALRGRVLSFACRCLFSGRVWKPRNENGATAPFVTYACTLLSVHSVMAAVRGRPSGLPGCRFPGFPACVQLPPLRLETNVAASTMKRRPPCSRSPPTRRTLIRHHPANPIQTGSTRPPNPPSTSPPPPTSKPHRARLALCLPSTPRPIPKR
ncbi:hypothetical protein D3C75_878760 [compost metagenome]